MCMLAPSQSSKVHNAVNDDDDGHDNDGDDDDYDDDRGVELHHHPDTCRLSYSVLIMCEWWMGPCCVCVRVARTYKEQAGLVRRLAKVMWERGC